MYPQGCRAHTSVRLCDYDCHSHARHIEMLGTVQWLLPALSLGPRYPGVCLGLPDRAGFYWFYSGLCDYARLCDGKGSFQLSCISSVRWG